MTGLVKGNFALTKRESDGRWIGKHKGQTNAFVFDNLSAGVEWLNNLCLHRSVAIRYIDEKEFVLSQLERDDLARAAALMTSAGCSIDARYLEEIALRGCPEKVAPLVSVSARLKGLRECLESFQRL